MKRIYPLFMLLSAALFLMGCIKEDLSDCPAGIKVFFTYHTTYAGEGIDPSDVDKIDLFVFDEATGLLRAMVEDTDPRLSPDYFMTIPSLPQGDYRMVAWGGLHKDYTSNPDLFELEETTFEDAMLVFNHENEVEHTIGHLFFAELAQATVTAEREQKFYLPLIQNTNTINLTTEGLPKNEDSYILSIRDNNGRYKFDNSFAPDSDFTYKSVCGKDAVGQPNASLRKLKLAAHRIAALELYNETKGKSLYSVNLVELLNARGVDYDLQSVFDVHLKFNTDMSVDVMINEWQITEGGMILK